MICSVMDAGRGQVYIAYFRYNKNGLLEQIGTEKLIDPEKIVHEF